MHPLVSDLTKLSDQELHSKHNDLVTRLTQAYQSGSSLVGQLQLILEDYKQEIQRRNQIAYEEMMKKSKVKDGIIDIK